MKILLQTFSILFLALLLSGNNCFAQSKKPIDHSVYDSWKDIVNPVISNDGNHVAFEVNPQKGDGILKLYDAEDDSYHIFERGSKAAFSSNSNFVVYSIKPQFDTVRSKKLKKVKKDKLPKDSLGIYYFETGKTYKFPGLSKISVPKKSSDWVAVLIEDVESKEVKVDSIDKAKSDSTSKSCDVKKDGKTLLLINPATGDSVGFTSVCTYGFSKNGSTCAFVQVRKDSIDSVFVSVFNTGKMTTEQIFAEKGSSGKIALDEQGEQIVFTFSTDTIKNKSYDLKYFGIKNSKFANVLTTEFRKQNDDLSVSPHGKIFFNEKGDELYFGTIKIPDLEVKDTLTDDEKVSLDIWNWNDAYLQPQQFKNLKKEQERSYTAVYFPGEDRTVQLGSEQLESISIDPKAEGAYTIGVTNSPYRKMLSWDGSRYKDVYLIDRNNGDSKLVLEQIASSISFSPKQNFIAWYSIADSSWNIYTIKTGESENVTSNLSVNFYNELNDVPNEAGTYGMAGWTENEKLILYDRYDLWQIEPSGKDDPKTITGGEGRENKIKFRYIKLDKEERFLPEKLILSVFQEVNKKAGFSGLDLKKGKLESLVLGDYYFKGIKKAKNEDKIIWRKESFTQFPDLYLSDIDFANPVKLSDANPQQSEYNWGTTELVDWVSFNGDSLQGILVKPENFDPNKKYPMLVYFYERSSDRLNRYYTPKPIRSTINWTYYASNEYLVFIPDIVYRTGYPGPSAYDCIVSGTQILCERYSFIDRENLGIQGQSWGGYQTAYIITQTDLYKAAMAGAPVSNMTSAYGGIRWGSGLSRAFQYEETQSRIGATLWERRDLYILNSPLFFADQINTPLLMMHNDKDGAVPWYQGIEFFSALRRLNKPVWMLVYNKAPHNLKRRADMEDLTVRMQQFFDHFLKGSAEPAWMKSGIPALNKGKDFGFELD